MKPKPFLLAIGLLPFQSCSIPGRSSRSDPILYLAFKMADGPTFSVGIERKALRKEASSFEVAHVLKLDGQAHVEGQETRVWTDRDPDTGRISAAPLPAPIAERMKTG